MASVTVTAPSGSETTTSQPTVTWTETLDGGDSQTHYEVIVESGSYGFTPGSGTQAWTSGLVASAALSDVVGTVLADGVTYRVFVQITETGGTTSAWAFSTFTVLLASNPTVIGISPTMGPVEGGTSVTITGANYSSDATVDFGGNAGTSVIVVSTTEITVISPAGTGTVHTTVTNATGTSSTSSADEFTYEPNVTISATSGKYPIVAATEYWFTGSVFAATNTRACTLQALWYDRATLLATTPIETANDSTSDWTQLSGNATAPSSANYVEIGISIASAEYGEVHYLDEAGFFPAAATEWVLGGYVGYTYAVITRSDNIYLRDASAANPCPISETDQVAPYGSTYDPDLQLSTVADFEVTPTDIYSYSAVVSIETPALSSDSATSGDATIGETLSWWEIDPTRPQSAVNAQMVSWTPEQVEQSSSVLVLNQPTAAVISNAMMGQEFSAVIEVFDNAIYAGFNALLTSQKVVFISSPWGPLDSGWFRMGPTSMSSGGSSGTSVKSTTLKPSTASAGHRTVAIQALAQPRPPV